MPETNQSTRTNQSIIMTQTLIALFIVALALCWVLVRLVRTFKGRDGGCNCGSRDCPHCPKKES